ncbi:MAG: hypothetical protein QOI81_318 [Actinomycetota bacterium]|jgi:2-hydroxy-3-keto-5-methylthiopentenyl-1-phosphate phosphatase|nr:hypothetical protein [Actinomycetota bacterium]
MLEGTREEMLAFVLDHCPMDPTFVPFLRWLEEQAMTLTVVSDGSAFHIEPMLAAAGVTGVPVLTNELVFGSDGHFQALEFPNAHPECVGCGTCKMLAVKDAQAAVARPVAFVGDGASDRFAVLYADVVFAKRELPAICEAAGVAYRPWETFDDVRASLEAGKLMPVAPAPVICPGWTLP